MKSALKTTVAAVAIGLAAMPATAQERPNTVLVLDASGSMWGQIDGVNKIVIARDVVADILGDFPEDENLGLVAYGHRERGQCTDIETLVEPGRGTAAEITRIVNGLNPRGMTPMTDAVIAAAQSLRHTENAATVILVSDGIETCHADPCAAARALAESGVDFTAHVIGFDVAGEAEARAQMQCIADETGGVFLTADNADELNAALQQVVTADPDPASTQRAEAEPEEDVSATASLSAPETAPAGSMLQVAWEGPGDERDNVQIATVGGEHIRFVYTEQGNPVSILMPPEPGEYELRYEFRGREVIHTRPINLTEAEVAFSGPQSAPAGSVAEIGWVGPNAERDNIQIATPGGAYHFWEYTSSGNPVRLQMPAEPGQYELRYEFNGDETIHTQPFEVTETQVSFTAPASAPAGSVVSVHWTGPNAERDNIQIAPAGGRYYFWEYTSKGNPVNIQTPMQPGDYELRYEFRGDQIIHTQPLTITPTQVDITAPATAPAGAVIEVRWIGPDADKDNIQVAHVGGRYINYVYTQDGEALNLKMPDEPGTYELRYSFRDQEIVFTRPITVTAK